MKYNKVQYEKPNFSNYKEKKFFVGNILKKFTNSDFEKLEQLLGFDIRIIPSFINNVSKPSEKICSIILKYTRENNI